MLAVLADLGRFFANFKQATPEFFDKLKAGDFTLDLLRNGSRRWIQRLCHVREAHGCAYMLTRTWEEPKRD